MTEEGRLRRAFGPMYHPELIDILRDIWDEATSRAIHDCRCPSIECAKRQRECLKEIVRTRLYHN